jgi:hypothetical protein
MITSQGGKEQNKNQQGVRGRIITSQGRKEQNNIQQGVREQPNN